MVGAAAAVLTGGMLAVGCATVGASPDRSSARRAQIERELAREAPALAEYARLERAGQAAKVSGAQAAALAQPSELWLALLEALSREMNSGVTVSRLEGGNTAVELQVGADDSATCVAWMERLGRMQGVESVEMIDLKSSAAGNASQREGAIEAVVRLRWRGDGETRPVRRAAYRERALAERTSGRAGDRGLDRSGDSTGDIASVRSAR
jgi:Tfp pilus assembly protein PilN